MTTRDLSCYTVCTWTATVAFAQVADFIDKWEEASKVDSRLATVWFGPGLALLALNLNLNPNIKIRCQSG